VFNICSEFREVWGLLIAHHFAHHHLIKGGIRVVDVIVKESDGSGLFGGIVQNVVLVLAFI